jgi:uncharacterized membrane protein YgcG
METKTIFTIVVVALFAAVVLTGTVVGTQYVSAWHHGHHGHASAMSSGGMSSSVSSGGGGSSSGSSGGGGSSSGSSGGGSY